MNQIGIARIAQLYDQALILKNNGDIVEGELDFVKFAELIVRECAYINFYKRTDISLKDAYRVSQVILEHFGVEE
jgi:hypothetical protein